MTSAVRTFTYANCNISPEILTRILFHFFFKNGRPLDGFMQLCFALCLQIPQEFFFLIEVKTKNAFCASRITIRQRMDCCILIGAYLCDNVWYQIILFDYIDTNTLKIITSPTDRYYQISRKSTQWSDNLQNSASELT